MEKTSVSEWKALVFMCLFVINCGALFVLDSDIATNFAMRITSAPLIILTLGGGAMLFERPRDNGILAEFLILLLLSGFTVWGIYNEGMASIAVVLNVLACAFLSTRSLKRLTKNSRASA